MIVVEEPAGADVPPAVFAQIAATSPNGLAVVDQTGAIRFVNERLLQVFEGDVASLERHIETWLVDAPADSEQWLTERVLPDRGDQRCSVVVEVSRVGEFRVVRATDVTGQRAVEEDLLEREAQYRLMVETIPGVVYTAHAGPLGMWTYVSPQIESLLGFTAGEWLAHPDLWSRQLYPDDRNQAVTIDQEQIHRGPSQVLQPQTYRMVRKDGSVVWVRDGAAVIPDDDGRLVYHGVLTDVTHEKALEARLEYLATHDQLTGLLNRASFMDHLETNLHRGPVGVAFVDLDGFKRVNDSYGHRVGDHLLRLVGEALGRLTNFYPEVVSSRIAGDEFVLYAPGYGRQKMEILAEEALAAMRAQTIAFDGRVVQITASIGVAVASAGLGAEEAVSVADHAMYRAKARGSGFIELN